MESSLYLNLKQYDNALINLNRALEIEPNNTHALRNRGVAYLDLKQYDNALINLNRVLKIEPNDSFALSNMEVVYSHVGGAPITLDPVPMLSILLPTSSTETIPQQYQVPSSFFGQTNNNRVMSFDDYYEPNSINSNGMV